MKPFTVACIVFGIILLLTFIFLGIKLIGGYDHVYNTIPNSSCDELLSMIQKDGMKPNYQYDVREWIVKECWK